MLTQEFFSISQAAHYLHVPDDEVIRLATLCKLPVCFDHDGFVGLFRSTANGEAIVGLSPVPANYDDDTLPPLWINVFYVHGLFRSFMRPVRKRKKRLKVWLCPTAIEAVTISSDSEQLPVVPDGLVLCRVDAGSRCFDDSPVRIEDWLFFREDLDRLTEPAVEPPAAEQPAAEQPATPGSVAVNDAPAVTDAAAGQGEALTPTTAREHDSNENLERLTEPAAEQPAAPGFVAPEVTAADGKKDEAATSTPAFRPRVAWQIALFDAWPAICKGYGRVPSPAEAVRWMKRNDDSGTILNQGTNVEMWWQPQRRKPKKLPLRRVENVISAWRTGGVLPA